MTQQIKGMSLYKCGTCEYHFAIEHGHYPDATEAHICPICSDKKFEFERDIEVKER